MSTQYVEFVDQVVDDLTEALGKWVGVDEAFVPDTLRPFVTILSKVSKAQLELKRGSRCATSSGTTKIPIELS